MYVCMYICMYVYMYVCIYYKSSNLKGSCSQGRSCGAGGLRRHSKSEVLRGPKLLRVVGLEGPIF